MMFLKWSFLIFYLFFSLELKATPDCSKNTIHCPVKNDWLVLHLRANPELLNPLVATDVYSSEVFPYIFDSLVSYNVFTAVPEGKLAKSWAISPNGLIHDFFLRKNILFHDGHALTAKDVKFTFDSILNPKVDAPVLRSYLENLNKVEVVGPHHVRFYMKTKYYRNLFVLGTQEILPKHIYSQGDFNKHPNNRKPVGSGPYVFEKWDSGRVIELKRFKKWWGNNTSTWKERNNFYRILFRIITEDSVSVMMIKKEALDAMEPTVSQFTQDFSDPKLDKKFYKFFYQTIDGRGYNYIGWNLNFTLFSDKRVRKALALAMPRDEINKKIFGGLRKPCVGPFPQNNFKTDPSIKPIPYDLNQAKALLEKAGWKDTNGDGVIDKEGKKFSFELKFTVSVPDNERIALIYQQSLKKLKIEMTLKTLEWVTFFKQIKERRFESFIMGRRFSFDYDPYQMWHSNSVQEGSNYVSYSNKTVDKILEKARVTLDRKKRNKLYQQFSKIFVEDMPILFLFENEHLFLAHRRFQKIYPIGKLGLDPSFWFTPFGQEKYVELAER